MALTMVLLMLLLATLIGTAQQEFVKLMRASTGQVKRWGGIVLIAVGGWLIVLAIWAHFFARIFPV